MKHENKLGEACRCRECDAKHHKGSRELAFFALFAMPLAFALTSDVKDANVAAFVALALVNCWLLVWLCLKVNVKKVI